jgi:hypothetical protein
MKIDSEMERFRGCTRMMMGMRRITMRTEVFLSIALGRKFTEDDQINETIRAFAGERKLMIPIVRHFIEWAALRPTLERLLESCMEAMFLQENERFREWVLWSKRSGTWQDFVKVPVMEEPKW